MEGSYPHTLDTMNKTIVGGGHAYQRGDTGVTLSFYVRSRKL